VGEEDLDDSLDSLRVCMEEIDELKSLLPPTSDYWYTKYLAEVALNKSLRRLLLDNGIEIK